MNIFQGCDAAMLSAMRGLTTAPAATAEAEENRATPTVRRSIEEIDPCLNPSTLGMHVTDGLSADVYQGLLDMGWRRCGTFLYKVTQPNSY